MVVREKGKCLTTMFAILAVCVCVPPWHVKVIKKGCERAIQRFLCVNEEQDWQPQDTINTRECSMLQKKFPAFLWSYSKV